MNNHTVRQYTLLDGLLMQVDKALRTVSGNISPSNRPNPAHDIKESCIAKTSQQKVIGLMRVNYAGEVSAQALYQGQALVAHSKQIKEKLYQAATEENDHLLWCKQRLDELQGRTSYLDPFWYVGSFCIGVSAGMISDGLSLGFLAETEYQVIKHIDSHLSLIPASDLKTRTILQQMRIDEAQHATTAVTSGATELPYPVKKIMTIMSKVMTSLAYII